MQNAIEKGILYKKYCKTVIRVRSSIKYDYYSEKKNIISVILKKDGQGN